MSYLWEMHVHTAECDRCAAVGGAEIVRLYADAGYSGLVITDHYFSIFFDWFADELIGAAHRDIINRWLRGYYAARNEGEKRGITVLCGAEVRFQDQINDYLLYGLDEEFFYRAPLLHTLHDVEELKQTLPEDALIVQAHPFRNRMTVCDPSPLFGIEGYNGGTEDFRNEMAKLFAGHYGKPLTSGSDFHNRQALGKGGICVERSVRTAHDLTEVLRSGQYRRIENGKVTAD